LTLNKQDALKYFKNYKVMFKTNSLGLYEVMSGNMTIPGIVVNDQVFFTELREGDMLGPETLVMCADILQARLEEAQRIK